MIEETAENSRTGLEIAVIGMAGKFPGAENIRQFWKNIKHGVESIVFFTGRELEETGIPSGVSGDPRYVKASGMLEGIEYFDADFFGYTPREAVVMDPQMRIFHECAWTALENAGYFPGNYHGHIGLYAGATSHFGWEAQLQISGKARDFGEYAASHFTNKDYLSLRVSYKLNLKGPAVIVQSTCSTSLLAIHMACQAILNGECEMALAGGVTVTFLKRGGYLYSEGMILSPDGHCRAFDAKAKGTVGGNGVGVVVLKRLEEAAADGDYIYGVVKGSAANNDGVRKVGFTAPSIEGEAEVIMTAQEMAEVEAGSISYVETHGTGTELGDPVEIEALKLAFRCNKKGFCALGSVKTNVGHLDSAAGVAGFIKTLLMLQHRIIPPSLHFETSNPKIDFENSPFYVSTGLKEWKNENGLLRAGVSAFGIGGTNVHAVLEEWPMAHGVKPGGESSRTSDDGGEYRLLVLSAKTQSALDKMTANLALYLQSNPDAELADIAYTLQAGREAFPHRSMVICNSLNDAVDALDHPESGRIQSHYSTRENPSVVFMFPGQGSQYVNMGRELYEAEPRFRGEADRCFEILSTLLDYDIKKILYPGAMSDRSDIDRTRIAQPVIFVVEYALARLLMHLGINPWAMIGHSIGEYAAACLSGVFSLEEALKLVVLRGESMQQMPGGAMLSIPLSEEELIPLVESHPGISLAAVNSSSLCTVSGTHEAVDIFARQLEGKGYQVRRLHTSHAFHSAVMDPLLEDFEAAVRRLRRNPPKIPYISNLTGGWITKGEAADPRYWSTHLRKTVRFADGVKELLKKENVLFIEVGPGNVLSTFVRKHAGKKTGHFVLNLLPHPGEDAPVDRYFLNQIGRLWLYHAAIDWQGFYTGEERHRIPLPTYPFESKRYPVAFDMSQISAVYGKSALRKKNIADWFYIPQWNRYKLAGYRQDKAGKTGSYWLIFMDTLGLGEGLAELLEQEQREAVFVKKGQRFHRVNSREYTLNPAENDHYDALFKDLHTVRGIPGKILHLWNVTAEGKNRLIGGSLGNLRESAFYSLLNISRAIGCLGIDREVHLEVITDNMQDVIGGEGYCPGKALVLGPVKVIPREYPYIRCRCIDIDSETESAAPAAVRDRHLRQLLSELAAGPDPLQPVVAFRGVNRWVPVLQPVPLERPGGIPLSLRQEGVYLITGGLGGIGLVLAEYLVKRLKAKIILTGRTALPEPEEWQAWLDSHEDGDGISRRIGKVQELKKSGGDVLVLRADVACEEEMQAVVAQVKKRFGHIHGVIHAAGLADGEMIQKRSKETTEPVLAPKLEGTLVLDTVLRDEKPDFFMLCSSAASFLGPFGQVAYCSANAFLDAYALYKSSGEQAGPVIISTNWDTWQQVGMSVEAVKQLSGDPAVELKHGISPAEGVDVFGRILESGLPQVAVSTRDLPLMIERSRLKREDMVPLSGREKNPEEEVPLHQRPDIGTKYIEPEYPLEKTLAEIFRDFLGIRRVGIDDNFFELGMSSLDLAQINNRLQQTIGREIPLVNLFTFSTIRTLSQYLSRENKRDTVPPASNRDSESDGATVDPEDLLYNTVDLLKDT